MPNTLDTVFGKALVALDDKSLAEIIREALVQKAMGAQNLTPGEKIRDLFLEGEQNKIPSKTQVEVTSPVAASGAGAEPMIARFSDTTEPEFRAKQYDKLAGMLGDLSSAVKAMNEHMTTLAEIVGEVAKNTKQPEQIAAKSDDEEDEEQEVNIAVEEDEEGEEKSELVNQISASILTKADDEEEEEQEINIGAEEDEEEEESGKSLSDQAKLRFAKGFLGGAKDALVKAKKGTAKGGKGGKAKALRREIERAAWKARDLAKGAAAGSEKPVVREANEVLGQIEEFMFLHDIPATKAGQKGKKPKMQEKWPDHEGFEKSLVKVQTDMAGLMNMVANMSKKAAGKPTEMEMVLDRTENPLAKANETYFADKVRMIEQKAEVGQLSDNAQGAAMELVGLMQAAKSGRVAESVVTNSVATASAEVRGLFPEWGPQR